MLYLFPALCSKFVDILDLCKLREAARAGKRLQDSHVRQERESAGMGDFTGNVNAAAVYFGHRHLHLRTGEIFGKALAQRPRELRSGQSPTLDAIEQIHPDLAVRPAS